MSATEATAWLNANVAHNALVETYESEILFGLQTRAHFPPDTLNVEIIRKRQIDAAHELSYDPHTVNPDYVVVGRFGRVFHVYDSLLESQYQPAIEIGTYTIYKKTDAVSTP